jgi:hypothetical protein
VFDKFIGKHHFKRSIGDARVIALEEARLRACDWARRLGDGEAVPTQKERAAEMRAKQVTVEELFHEYFNSHVDVGDNVARPQEVMAGFRLHWAPIKGNTISRMEPKMVQDWVNDLVANRGGATASKQFNHFRSMVNFGLRMNIVKLEHNLVGKGVIKVPATNYRHTYLKPGDEVQRFMEELKVETQLVQDVIMTLLLTGQRKSNVLRMEWHEPDMERATWNIPASKAKTRRPYVVALVSHVMEILRAAARNGHRLTTK